MAYPKKYPTETAEAFVRRVEAYEEELQARRETRAERSRNVELKAKAEVARNVRQRARTRLDSNVYDFAYFIGNEAAEKAFSWENRPKDDDGAYNLRRSIVDSEAATAIYDALYQIVNDAIAARPDAAPFLEEVQEAEKGEAECAAKRLAEAKAAGFDSVEAQRAHQRAKAKAARRAFLAAQRAENKRRWALTPEEQRAEDEAEELATAREAGLDSVEAHQAHLTAKYEKECATEEEAG